MISQFPQIYNQSVRTPSSRLSPSAFDSAIVATRWTDDRNCGQADGAPATPGRHQIAIAMKTTRLKLSRNSLILFEGPMAAGTLFVANAALPLSIDFHAPCDFIRLSVPNEWFAPAETDDPALKAPEPQSLDGFTVRDALAEGLARSLIDAASHYDDRYADSVGQTIVMRLLGAAREQPKNGGWKASPLPVWRLRRVQDYVAAHIGEAISLPKLASVAGLSRMHFAAQFRAATGYRPHEYLLFRRIERAKSLLVADNTPIVEIALSVGFQTQAHFSTVFKRFTKQTPLGWRRAGPDIPSSASGTLHRLGGPSETHMLP